MYRGYILKFYCGVQVAIHTGGPCPWTTPRRFGQTVRPWRKSVTLVPKP